MLVQLALAAVLIGVTVIIQALFMSSGLQVLKTMERQRHHILKQQPHFIVVLWILFLLIPVVLDVFIWAAAYRMKGAVPNFEDALYFSMVTFTTVGYGNIVLDRESRLLATFEAMNGWIIFGWATALVMIVIQRFLFTGDCRWSKVTWSDPLASDRAYNCPVFS